MSFRHLEQINGRLGKDVYELKHKQTFQLSRKEDFSFMALEDVRETHLFTCIVQCATSLSARQIQIT